MSAEIPVADHVAVIDRHRDAVPPGYFAAGGTKHGQARVPVEETGAITTVGHRHDDEPLQAQAPVWTEADSQIG